MSTAPAPHPPPHPALLALAEKLVAVATAAEPPSAEPAAELSVDRYLSTAWFERERDAIFRRLPLPVAHASELAAPTTCLTLDVTGVPVLVTRAADGQLRAFRNACRHRATRLLDCDAPCARKALVCPYHGWTYDLAGQLIHVPHERTFDGLDRKTRGLVPAHVEERHGLVWLSLEPFAATDYLGALDDELASFALADHTVFRRATAVRTCNWKLIVDAFLESYHIRGLHRDSIYRFFLDARAAAEPVSPHVRAIAARRTLADVADTPPAQWSDLRAVATPTYLLFPSSVLILHPDYTSWLSLTPLAADRTHYVHTMLVPAPPRTDAARAHFAKSFDLIDGKVFQAEDLHIAEQMHRGLEAGANDTVLFGGLETPALWFHADLERHLDDAR